MPETPVEQRKVKMVKAAKAAAPRSVNAVASKPHKVSKHAADKPAKVDAKAVVIIRIRGNTGTRYDANHAFKMLHLNRVYHAAVYTLNASSKGTLHMINSFCAYGPASPAAVAELLTKRGKTAAAKPLTAADVAKAGFKSIEEAAAAIADGSISFVDFCTKTGCRPVFTLNPPRKGFTSAKFPYPRGVLGNNGATIDKLVKKMV